jgi:hypothetical protein
MQRESLDMEKIFLEMPSEEQRHVLDEVDQLLQYKIYLLGLEEEVEKMEKQMEKELEHEEHKKHKKKRHSKEVGQHKHEKQDRKGKQKVAQETTPEQRHTVTSQQPLNPNSKTHNNGNSTTSDKAESSIKQPPNVDNHSNTETPPSRPILHYIPLMLENFVQISRNWLTKAQT